MRRNLHREPDGWWKTGEENRMVSSRSGIDEVPFGMVSNDGNYR